MSISTQPGEVDAKFARDAWLRALAKTATIGEQGITLPALIDRLAGQFERRAGARLCGSLVELRAIRASLQPIFSLGYLPAT